MQSKISLAYEIADFEGLKSSNLTGLIQLMVWEIMPK